MKSCESDWKLKVRSAGATAVALVLVVGLAGCSAAQGTYERDLTGWVDGGPVTIDAQVEGVSGDGHMGEIADVVVMQVLDSSDTYNFGYDAYPTPELVVGDHIRIREGAPTNHVSLKDGRFYFVLQIYGTPEDVAAGRDAEGFDAPYFVLGVFDQTWKLIDGQRDLYPQLQGVLALYPGGLDGVRQLVADAYAKREAMAPYNVPLTPENAALAESAPNVTTPGPLGEWRRAHGFERPDATPTADIAAQVAATPPDRRQLPTGQEEFWPNIEESLGVSELVQWNLWVDVGKPFTDAYQWLGLRFPGVGVVGPFNTEVGKPIGVVGYGPPSGPVEIVAWSGQSIDDLSAAVVLMRVSPTEWEPSQYLWIDATSNVGDYTIETLSEYDAQMRITELASKRDGS